MHNDVKRCADTGDIKGLRYVFIDCLDIDPTFEKYKEDYVYCKNVEGLFEAYRELMPLSVDKREWNMVYWDNLKRDLLKNFSKKRFEHMIEVAKVVYAEKIERILKERQNTVVQSQEHIRVRSEKTNINTTTVKTNIMEPNRALEEEKRQMALKYQRDREEEDRKKAEIIRKRKEFEKQQNINGQEDYSKKWLGVVVGIVIVILLIVVMTKLL